MTTPLLRTAAPWAALVLLGLGHPAPAAARPQEAGESSAPQRALLERYCFTCHNERLRTAGLVLSEMDPERVGRDAERWERVVRKLRARAMPPAGRPRPDAAAYAALTSWLEAELDRAAPALAPAPRPFAVHRLNRVEYGNAVRDLLGVEVDTELLLPPDDDDEGFDNIADVLSVSPTLMERYLFAARRISQLAVGDPAVATASEIYRVPEALVQDERTSDDLPFGSRGGVAIRHYFPIDGEYSIRIRLQRSFYDVIAASARWRTSSRCGWTARSSSASRWAAGTRGRSRRPAIPATRGAIGPGRPTRTTPTTTSWRACRWRRACGSSACRS